MDGKLATQGKGIGGRHPEVEHVHTTKDSHNKYAQEELELR
jgi:hypothetical protein